ncbi:MAG: hypothetical protein U1A24_03050 [Cypionkella sp.]|uniref:hypothetical protein n=1 Tax=Cypionkella sp. TaxID=2811411 RepID=UPI002ABC5B52|nr:hypothetical protein [Cypionkella sp.]MDZ4309524.1 hypothetical protein [Cypionkella sp.]
MSIYSTAAGYAVSGGRNGQTITKANLLVLLKQSAGKPFDLNEANSGATFGLCNIAPRRKVHDDALDFALAPIVPMPKINPATVRARVGLAPDDSR